MKIKLVLLFSVAFTLLAKSQAGLNNLSFENWSINTIGYAPSGWLGQGITMQTSGAQHGTKYVRMSTGLLPAFLMLGSITNFTGAVTGGVPYNQTPVTISGFYKLASSSATSSAILSAYTKGQGAVSSMATQIFTTNNATWTSFSANFLSLGFGSTAVDSLFIVFNSVTSNSTASVVFDIDHLSIENAMGVGVDEQSIGTAFLVFPNPARNNIHVFSKAENPAELIVYATDGREIKRWPVNEGDNMIPIVDFASGIYVYRLVDRNGQLLFTSKLSVLH